MKASLSTWTHSHGNCMHKTWTRAIQPKLQQEQKRESLILTLFLRSYWQMLATSFLQWLWSLRGSHVLVDRSTSLNIQTALHKFSGLLGNITWIWVEKVGRYSEGRSWLCSKHITWVYEIIKKEWGGKRGEEKRNHTHKKRKRERWWSCRIYMDFFQSSCSQG